MEVGTEISQKIRSAIKAKLMEIGSYVDDELPDYIMVMVANKKSQQQMSDDLSLFLGTNTDVFTTWLNGLLVKLQTVSTDSSKSVSEKPKSTKDKKKDKKVKDSGLESKKEKRKVSKKTGDSDGPKAKSARIFTTTDPADNEDAGPNSPLSKDESGVTKEQQKENAKDDDVEDVRQLLVTEAPADELAQELETTEARIEKLSSVSKDANQISKDTLVAVARGQAISSREVQSEKASIPKKRKCPSSVVTAMRRNDDSDDGNDRSAPVVASVVKVTARKSSFPQSMQANSDADSLTEEGPTGEATKASPVDGHVSINTVKQALSEVLIQWQDQEDDIRMFCKSVEKTLRKMSPGDFAISKLKIQKMLFDYEMSQQKSKAVRTQIPTVAPSGSSQANVAKHSNSGPGGLGQSATSHLPVCHSLLSASQDNGDQSKTDLRQDSVGLHQSNHSKETDASSSHTEHIIITKNKSEEIPDRIIFGRKQIVTECASFVESRYSADGKNPGSSGGSNPSLNNNEKQSVSTAVSSTVIESSGLDSPSSSRPSSFVHTKRYPSSSSSSSRKLLASDAFQRSATNSDLPSTILVSSLHQKRRFHPDSPSVLRQSLSHDPVPSKNSQSQLSEGVPDSSKEISPEQLKVLAKNLKITVVNKRALRPGGKSNSEDSSSEDSDDDSDTGDEDSDDDGRQGVEEGSVLDQQIPVTDHLQEKTD